MRCFFLRSCLKADRGLQYGQAHLSRSMARMKAIKLPRSEFDCLLVIGIACMRVMKFLLRSIQLVL